MKTGHVLRESKKGGVLLLQTGISVPVVCTTQQHRFCGVDRGCIPFFHCCWGKPTADIDEIRVYLAWRGAQKLPGV